MLDTTQHFWNCTSSRLYVNRRYNIASLLSLIYFGWLDTNPGPPDNFDTADHQSDPTGFQLVN